MKYYDDGCVLSIILKKVYVTRVCCAMRLYLAEVETIMKFVFVISIVLSYIIIITVLIAVEELSLSMVEKYYAMNFTFGHHTLPEHKKELILSKF